MGYVAAVTRGAKLLDAKRPGWEGDIVLNLLDLKDCKVCILGQLFGGYSMGREALAIFLGRPYGFSLSHSEGEDGDYPLLTRTWARLILKRLAKRFGLKGVTK